MHRKELCSCGLYRFGNVLLSMQGRISRSSCAWVQLFAYMYAKLTRFAVAVVASVSLLHQLHSPKGLGRAAGGTQYSKTDLKRLHWTDRSTGPRAGEEGLALCAGYKCSWCGMGPIAQRKGAGCAWNL